MNNQELDITVRELDASDQCSWVDLLYEYIPHTPDPLISFDKILDPQTKVSCLVAENHGRYGGFLVGFAIFFTHEHSLIENSVCYLDILYVTPGFRRLGIGRTLIDRVIEHAKEEGLARVYWVTENDNPARALYEEYASADYVRYAVDLVDFV